ncbi:NIPSNAP family protein [Lacibacter luteus]|nr:NIPSNAP family protein [Lacibacter luteus]
MRKKMNFFFCLLASLLLFSSSQLKPAKQSIYQLTVYHFTTAEQEKLLDNYLQHALLPALHRQNYSSIGVFKAIANDTAKQKQIYVLIPATSTESFAAITTKLEKDSDYLQAGKEYLDAVYTAAPYSRIETILLKAFHLAPTLTKPNLQSAKKERVYELRSYESATEKIFRNKVHMFNEGDEIGLFKRLNFNAIFYSEVIAGGKMPNLMYMTSFENMDDRNAHWKAFGADPQWKKLSGDPFYKNNVSHIDITFLRPADYSDY